MSSVIGWREYEHRVARIAAELFMTLTGGSRPNLVRENRFLPGDDNDRNQIDVLAEDDSVALVIECKEHGRELSRELLIPTLYRFVDLARGNPGRIWALAFVAPEDIPNAARRPSRGWLSTLYSPPNLLGGSLSSSTSFVYFDPSDEPSIPVPFFVSHGSHRGVEVSGMPIAVPVEDLWDRLNEPSRPPAERVEAGMALAVQEPEILHANKGALRILIHGLMHLGRVREASYIRRIFDDRGVDSAQVAVETLMIEFHLTRRRDSRAIHPGRRSIERMQRLLGSVPPHVELAIRTFAGPMMLRWGEEQGRELLDGAGPLAEALETEDAPYYELLRAIRTSQLVESASERSELIDSARAVIPRLPAANLPMGEALLVAAEEDRDSLHGVETLFDVEAWRVHCPVGGSIDLDG